MQEHIEVIEFDWNLQDRESVLKGPISFDSRTNSKAHTRINSEVDGAFKDIIKKMQEEIDKLYQENAELKSRESCYPHQVRF